jgi:NAD(P)H-dependent FMN reductase
MNKALLLIGSPRKQSVSRLLGETLLGGLKARGFESETLPLPGLLETQEGRARLAGEFPGANLTILAAPVYVDALPAPAMRALEFLAEGREPAKPGRAFAALINCGFPEASHTDIAMAACRLFARDAGLTFAGGLGFGGGGALDAASLEKGGGPARHARRALDLAAQALAQGQPIPAEAVQLAARPAMPRWVYLLVSEIMWGAQAFKRGNLFKLGARPYRNKS